MSASTILKVSAQLWVRKQIFKNKCPYVGYSSFLLICLLHLVIDNSFMNFFKNIPHANFGVLPVPPEKFHDFMISFCEANTALPSFNDFLEVVLHQEHRKVLKLYYIDTISHTHLKFLTQIHTFLYKILSNFQGCTAH